MNEDGSRLWLRYDALPQATAARYAGAIHGLLVLGASATMRVVRDELTHGLRGLLKRDVQAGDAPPQTGSVLVGTASASDVIRAAVGGQLDNLGPEGFVLTSTLVGGQPMTILAGQTDVGVLYAAFHFLRLLQTGQPIDRLAVASRPRVRRRLLNHWDNLDRSIERGYAGRSLWEWDKLPGELSPRYTAYARANASIGINGTVLNNVNANPLILSSDYLKKVAALADHWRPYGIRVYVSVNFASPRLVGKLPTNDPLDPSVVAWWREKADEIYRLVPDFGGFLVKANSEGQPGPQDYNRTHADGANVLADALAPHDGIVMYRAFVYDDKVDPDRVKRAYLEFTRLDGKFRPNVTVQVKNGPLDFMPREPFHPLFGGMKKTPVLAELQATQEYLGQSRHLVYLAPMWKEFLDADTHCAGPGSTVDKVVDGSIYPYEITGMAAVANTGTDANWCGHDFSQANWYAFGRLAWDPDQPAEHLAEEWIRMTFTHDPRTVDVLRDLMLSSRETFVDYTMPLGLHHLIGGDHYAPMPENNDAPRRDWTATYYHRASGDGIGFDRTTRGSDAVSHYFSPLRQQFDDPKTCPENLLLWFHHLPWDHKLRSGETLWCALCHRYHRGAANAVAMQTAWQRLADQIDPARHQAVSERLAIQVADAAKWRDHCLQYFQQFSKRPVVAP